MTRAGWTLLDLSDHHIAVAEQQESGSDTLEASSHRGRQAVALKPSTETKIYGLPGNGSAIAELADIWERLLPVLMHCIETVKTEAGIRAQQHEMIRTGQLLMPSPFSDDPDRCTLSYYIHHHFWYCFDAAEEYFWISGSLLKAFALQMIYFPARRVAVNVNPHDIQVDFSMLADFERLRSATTKPAPSPAPHEGSRLVVTGFVHYMHVLLNELPALDHAAAAGLADKMQLVVVYEPFGPTSELFPEFAGNIRRRMEIAAINRDHRLVVGLGSWTITRSTQLRVRRAAVRNAEPATIAARDRFRAAHAPVFWLSVKPFGKTCLRQSKVLAQLMVAAKDAYPSAGFILNGTSRPWDGPWSRQTFDAETALIEAVANDILSHVTGLIRDSVQVVSGACVCDEIAWGEAADFYFCHGGTMHNKIGWVHHVPGMIHCSHHFKASFIDILPANPLEDPPPCYFVPPELIVDCDPEPRTDIFGNERTDEPDYYFTSISSVIDAFLKAFRNNALRSAESPEGVA